MEVGFTKRRREPFPDAKYRQEGVPAGATEAYDLNEQRYTQENPALDILGNNILYYLYKLK